MRLKSSSCKQSSSLTFPYASSLTPVPRLLFCAYPKGKPFSRASGHQSPWENTNPAVISLFDLQECQRTCQSRKKKNKNTAWLKFLFWLQALIRSRGQLGTQTLLYLQTWIISMASLKGLINTSFYFGVCQESEGSIVLGPGGAAFCVQRALQGKYGAGSTDLCFAAKQC